MDNHNAKNQVTVNSGHQNGIGQEMQVRCPLNVELEQNLGEKNRGVCL